MDFRGLPSSPAVFVALAQGGSPTKAGVLPSSKRNSWGSEKLEDDTDGPFDLPSLVVAMRGRCVHASFIPGACMVAASWEGRRMLIGCLPVVQGPFPVWTIQK